jgi:glycosyltransferase involved in cell wall biosynthesis
LRVQLNVLPDDVLPGVADVSADAFSQGESSARPKPRVLHIGKFYPPHKGGMEVHLKNLCERLQHAVDAEVLVAGESGQNTTETINGVRVTRAPMLFEFNAAPICPSMVRLIRQSCADMVHLHFPNPAGILAYLASGRNGGLVVTYHSDIIRQKIMGRGFQPILERFLDRAAAIIVTSNQYIESSSVLRRFRDRCRVIPLGIEPDKFDLVDEGAVGNIRAQFGDRIVLSVGRLIYYKGFAHLIRAMKNVEGHLLIIGDGPLRASLRETARASGVSERITFLGEVDNVVPYLQAADVFALASVARSEAFGIVQLEAMACSKPVVNTNIATGVPFVSMDGLTGITVPPANSDALAAAINRLLSDADLRLSLGAAGRRRVVEEFSADRMAQRTLEVYQEVFDSQKPAM